MPRRSSRLAKLLLITVSIILASAGATLARAAQKALYWETIHPTVGSSNRHGVEFKDPDDTVERGPITSVEIQHAGFIHAIRLMYGRDGIGDLHGFEYGTKAVWQVPEGERIVRVEGDYGNYITSVQFFTDAGHSSPRFGQRGPKRFAISDPSGGALRTITGWANLERRKDLNRALVCMTLHFGAPYYIKEIKYDESALDAAKLKAAPYQVARMDLPNKSSLEQQVIYQQKKTVTTEKTLTFEQSFGLTFGESISAGVTAGLLAVQANAKWEFNSTTKFGHSYTNSSSQEVSWSVPVKVPPHSKIIAISTMRRYKARIPFTYTIAWYEGSKDNIKKQVTLPGVYEGTQVEDLQHEFREEKL